jgi:hypothetical protein
VILDRLRGGVEELPSVVARHLVKERVDAERARHEPLEIAELQVDPALAAPVNRGDVDHGSVEVVGRSGSDWAR